MRPQLTVQTQNDIKGPQDPALLNSHSNQATIKPLNSWCTQNVEHFQGKASMGSAKNCRCGYSPWIPHPPRQRCGIGKCCSYRS